MGSPTRKCYVVVQMSFSMGGIETMTLRMAKSIVSNGDILVVCGDKGPMSVLLPHDTDFFLVTRDRDVLNILPQYLKTKYPSLEVVLISFHPWSLVACYILRYRLGLHRVNCVRNFHLVTHSRSFFFSTKFPLVNKFLRIIFLSPPKSSVFFMNDAARDAHVKEWKTDLSGYGVLRLPLAMVEPSWNLSENNYINIVSVGRLVPFKAYNRAASSIVRSLLNNGVMVKWDIWGDGDDKDLIEEEIRMHDVAESVVLRGVLPYSEFMGSIINYDVFVGMGTALLEAAQSGIPSICAIDDCSHFSYGFLHEAPIDSVGDLVLGVVQIPIIEVLQRFYNASPVNRQEIGRLCAKSARERSLNIDQFVKSVRSSPKWPLQFNFLSLFLLAGGWFLFYLREIRTLRANRDVQ